MNPQRILDQLSDLNPDAILFDNMDAALIGLGYVGNNDPVAVYSYSLLYHQLLASGFTEDEALAYYQHNFTGMAISENMPIIVDDLQGGQ
jgi:hypothetical protein